MSSPSYLENKHRIYNWRERNIERNRFINREYMKRKYKWETISRKFLNCLLPPDEEKPFVCHCKMIH